MLYLEMGGDCGIARVMSDLIHPTALIESDVELGENVSVGAYTHIGGKVKIADNVVIENHVSIQGTTSIGQGTHIFPFASVGNAPQDLKYNGEDTTLEIGARNRIREYTTINRGTMGGGGKTKIGDDCLFMNGTHVGHDCMVGDNVILASNATLAGHVIIEDYAILGGITAVQQFCRVGAHAMVGGMSGVHKDLIPYGLATGNRASLDGLNLVGLRRRGFARDAIAELRDLVTTIFFTSDGDIASRVEAAADKYKSAEAQNVIAFIRKDGERGFTTPDLSGDK